MSFLTLTFRGIPFLWEERGGEDDKRFVGHDVPLKTGRWHEDMAAGPRVFTFSAYLLGGNVDLARARLRILHKACRDQRPGTLTHPIYGSVRCVNTGFKWKEKLDALNRIDLDLTFEEDNQADEPIASRWIGSALADAVNAARDAIADALDQVWDLVSMPAYVLDAAEDALADLAAEVFGTLGLLTAPVRAAVSTQTSLLTGIGIEADSISTPFVALFSSYSTDSNGRLLQLTADQAATTIAALQPLSTWTLAAAPTDTTSRAIAAQALAGLSAAVRRASLLEMANLSRLLVFASADEAIATRDQLADAMDVEILAAADEASIDSNPAAADVSDALTQARAEMIADLTERAASLKPVGHITLTASLPAIVLAYRLYGDGTGSAGDRGNTLDLVSDIAARNRVADPGQMPGGVPLEYLASLEGPS